MHVSFSLVKASGHADLVVLSGLCHEHDGGTRAGRGVCQDVCRAADFSDWSGRVNDTTGPLIEESWERYLDVFDRHLQNQPFLLGNRPGAGDYGCFGQMTMLVLTDPTPQAVSRRISPRAFAWTEAMEDHSGLEVDEADWINLDSPPETLNELLCEVGRLFVPFMVENAKAVASGEEMLECELDGRPWVQEAFVYQAKCLTWLKQRYDHLGEMDKARLDNVLSGTGCDALFANKGDKDEKRHSQ